MEIKYESTIVAVNKINLHFVEYKNNHPKLLCMHGLTANAFAFNGLVQAGLTKSWNVISVDLRGRGQSSKPAFAYSIKEHAMDIIGLLDYLKIDKISLCGHSFGGLLATYLAYKFPERVEKLIILDAAPKMNPKAAQMLMPALSRIDKHYPSFTEYIATIKQAPYITFWDEAMMAYYKADVNTAFDGTVESISNISDVTQIAINVSLEPWSLYFNNLKQASILICARGIYTMNEPLLPDYLAKNTASHMKNCIYKEVEGNHQTMLFGNSASDIVTYMKQFVQLTENEEILNFF